ncbi:MAG: hypothetical protein ACI9V1_000151 [Spirosomataceae bacterium]|jgi:hypothetical protein
MFSDKDLKQIEKRGSEIATVEQQIENFKTGFPFMVADRAATIGDGVIELDGSDLRINAALFDSQAPKLKLLKFVPASGAASRMFKGLFAAKDEGKSDEKTEQFFEKLKDFAFYKSLAEVVESEDDKQEVLEKLLAESGLDYGNLPKGLLEFHKYGGATRTAVEEHLVEGALYANKHGRVRLHFTVSPEHKKKFKALLSSVVPDYEAKFNVKYNITFSEQKPATDTIAVDMENEPFRLENGSILFRPAGHGALLENLNEQDADIIFIKNIDNVVPDHLKGETVIYKKALAGILINTKKQIASYLKRLGKEEVTAYMVQKVARFLKSDLCIEPPRGFRNWGFEEKMAYCKEKLNRPIRVCGMVKNVGEPGGGPFWAKNDDDSVSLHIVESAQFDMDNKKQQAIFENATHFNPVDLIVSTKDFEKKPFDLLQFRDAKTGFVTGKSMNGKELQAQELPGLWNGSMADWNTLFVEVPLITFNPVKTVNDLLRAEHQPEG